MDKLLLEKLRPSIERMVEEKLIVLLNDPDCELEIRPAVRRRLQRSLAAEKSASGGLSGERRGSVHVQATVKAHKKVATGTAASRRTVPAADVAAKLGLEW